MVTSATVPEWLRTIYPFAPRRFQTESGGLSYLDEGRGDEAVLMVHGNPTWSFYYRNLVLGLRQHIRCIVPDHLGCGLSEKPANFDYTLPRHIANLNALIESLGLRKVHLVVHDWGGPIGLGAMLARPEQLATVTILNTAAFADTVVPWRIRLCRTPILGELIVRGFNGFAGPATWMAVTKPLEPTIKRGYVFPYNNWANRIATHRFVVDIPSGRGTASDQTLATVESRLGLLQNREVQILWGGKDFCFNRHYYRRWQQFLPNAHSQLFEDGGHYILEDEGAACLEAIKRRLR